MTVNSISYKGVEIKITDPKMRAALEKINQNGDTKISEGDFLGPVLSSEELPKVVAEALDQAGAFKYDSSRQGFEGFLSVAPKVQQFGKMTESWKQNLIAPWIKCVNDSLEFKAGYFKTEVYPFIKTKGDFSPKKLADMSKKFLDSLFLLTGSTISPTETDKRLYVRSMVYNDCAIAKDLRPFVEEAVKSFENGVLWLIKDYSFIECDGDNCSNYDDVYVKKDAFPVVSNFTISKGVNSSLAADAGSTYYCFSGDTYLKASPNMPMSIAYASYLGQDTLPVVASYDECDDKTVFQRPSQLIEHNGYTDAAALLHLVLKNAEGENIILNVTPEHPLLAIRNNGTRWVKAGNLKDGDSLVTEDGKNLTVNMTETKTEYVTKPLYNLSFSYVDGGQHPTYYVSPDGKSWIPAHNVK